MARFRPVRSVIGWVAVLGFVVALAMPRATTAAGTSIPAWDGGVDLYRAGTFTTQKSWLWCTAAGVQIVDNIVDRGKDHTAAGQRRYFDWMRTHNRYALPLAAGVDPAGWTAGLQHFVDARYRLVSSATFDEALRSAVMNLRTTNLPVAITVSHGGHGWILTGFRATADPATTTSFMVTSVRVVGPLYGLQSKGGYDMPPDTRLTPAQLERYFTPWKYDPKPMIWDGRYVSIQPIPTRTVVTASPVSPAPSLPTPGSSLVADGSPTTDQRATPAPSTNPVAIAGVVASPTPGPTDTGPTSQVVTPPVEDTAALWWVVAVIAVAGTILALAALGIRARRGTLSR